MWLSRPLYELLPYGYMLLGIGLLIAAWSSAVLPSLLLVAGSMSLLAGIVLWLRRRDYRSRQAEYDEKSLDI